MPNRQRSPPEPGSADRDSLSWHCNSADQTRIPVSHEIRCPASSPRNGPARIPALDQESARGLHRQRPGRLAAASWSAAGVSPRSSPPASSRPRPARKRSTPAATSCCPGLINTHHHFYQTLTRAWGPVANAPLFPWLQNLYPVWARLTPRDLELATTVALAELLLSGCTTAADHHYLFPDGTGGRHRHRGRRRCANWACAPRSPAGP